MPAMPSRDIVQGQGVNLAPVELEHGERYGKLTVLRKVMAPAGKKRGPKWMCGCDCGNTRAVKTRQLMRGEVTACVRCMSRCAKEDHVS